MGLAITRMDESYPYDLIAGHIDNPDGLNMAEFAIEMDILGDEILGTFGGLRTNKRVELIKHTGKVVMVSLNSDNMSFSYTVMRDNETWTEPEDLPLPNDADDTSVIDMVAADAPFSYYYKTDDWGTRSFHLVSDGEYLYLFRARSGGVLWVDRYVLDTVTNELKRPYDIRYRRSGLKCQKDENGFDSLGYRNMDMEEFFEPTTRIAFPYNVLDFAVVLTPTSFPNEERWTIFALLETGRRAIYVRSFRRAKDDLCDGDAKRVYLQGLFSDQDQTVPYNKSDNTPGTIILSGVLRADFNAAETGFTGMWFEPGPGAAIYSNQQTCDGETVKTGQRIKLVIRTGPDNVMVSYDFAITNTGWISSTDPAKMKNKYTDAACGTSVQGYTFKESLYEKSSSTPFVFESSDGFVHVLYGTTKQSEKVYDPLSDKWVLSSSPAADQIRGDVGEWWNHGASETTVRYPWLYYNSPIDIVATAVEYGAYGYDNRQKLVGQMKRAYAFMRGNKIYLVNGEKIGDLDMKYIGQDLIDSTLIGYIEGAPPVPEENLTVQDDYDGMSSVEIVTASAVSQTYTQARDWGFDFQSEGTVGSFAYNVETSYSFLSENSAGSESVETISMSQAITGAWDESAGRWSPYNVGIALIKAKKADVYALSLKDSDRVFTYKIVSIPDSEEEYLTSFVINDNYIKNGSLDGYVAGEWIYGSPSLGQKGSYYKEEELKELESKIKNREERIRAFYKNYSSHAFQTIPALDSISRRNIINEYDWTATFGARTKEYSYATSASESLGGSFGFLGMAGVSVGGGLFSFYEVSALAGAHINSTFTKNQETTDSFNLEVYSDVERKGILGPQLEPASADSAHKVDAFKWKTAYLAPDESNFYDFFDRVVDPEWLQTSNVYANRLREARNRANKVWRTRHFVTFVSRVYAIE